MSDAPEQEGAESDLDHGLRDVETLFVIAHEAAPAHHRSGSLDDPTAGQNVEALLAFDAAHDFDDEVQEGGFVHELGPVVGAIGEEMLDPRPAFADQRPAGRRSLSATVHSSGEKSKTWCNDCDSIERRHNRQPER